MRYYNDFDFQRESLEFSHILRHFTVDASEKEFESGIKSICQRETKRIFEEA